MIELLKNIPVNVVGFRASGDVTKNDYEKVVFPQIAKHLHQGFSLNYVFVIETSLSNFTAGAWVEDLWLGLKKIAKWRRVAIVADDKSILKFTKTIGHIVPGEYKGFLMAEKEKALQWAGA
jgi:SpoIIAA-like